MNDNNIPAYALDIINANHQSTLKRLWILVFVLIFLLIGTNTAWIIYENKYEDTVTTTQTVTQDSGDGGSNTFSGDFYGGDNYGETNDNKNGD